MKSMREMINLSHITLENMSQMPKSYVEGEMAELIGYIAGEEISEEWVEFVYSNISNFIDVNDNKKYTAIVNEWITDRNIPITVLNMTQEWDNEDNSTYKFEVISDDRSNIQETISEGRYAMKSMREMINLMEGVVAVPGLNEGGPKPYEIPAYKRKEQGKAPLTPKDVQDQEKEGKLSDRENLKKAAENLEEKSTSEKQARFMAACAHGADYDSCPDDKVSKEFNKADTGTKQLSNAMKESHVSQGQMSNPGVARDILAMENDIADIGFGESDDYTDWSMRQGEMGSSAKGLDPTADNPNIERAIEMYQNYTSSFVDPQEAFDLVLRNFDEEGLDAAEIDEIAAAISKLQYGDPNEDDEDYTDWSMRQGEMGLEEEETADTDEEESNDEAELEEDLQNGYNEQYYASGNDYFPNGADSPVWREVGPSGARHGDNPGQKNMKTDIEEVHKELVYGYRSFLKEAAKPKKDPYTNKYDYLGAGLGAIVDSDDHKKWSKENARLKKKREADEAKAKAKTKKKTN